LIPSQQNLKILLVRHAPVDPPGYLYGSTDADVQKVSSDVSKSIHSRLANCQAVFSSPALRCIKTYQAVFLKKSVPVKIKEFWEQDFGDWEGLTYSNIPDQGELSGKDLVEFTPPNGESFLELCHRTQPPLLKIISERKIGEIAIFTHAGVIRSFLALALGSKEVALKFSIDNLSITGIQALSDGQFSISFVNQIA
jgi:broad specificity phosphatase PhoE